jgi:hypothetical protein
MAETIFDEQRAAIVAAAAHIYRAERSGTEPDPVASSVAMVVPVFEDASRASLRSAERQQARVNVGARTVARLAGLQDTIERGGLMGKVARVEKALTRIMEPTIYSALSDSQIIDSVRAAH